MRTKKTPEELAEARRLYRNELREKLADGGGGLTQTDLAYLGYLLGATETAKKANHRPVGSTTPQAKYHATGE